MDVTVTEINVEREICFDVVYSLLAFLFFGRGRFSLTVCLSRPVNFDDENELNPMSGITGRCRPVDLAKHRAKALIQKFIGRYQCCIGTPLLLHPFSRVLGKPTYQPLQSPYRFLIKVHRDTI